MPDTQKTIEQRVAEQFAGNTAEHQLTILHDDGIYRHIRMQKPGTGFYHYDLVTWPGYLAISGDLDSYVFQRVNDMFTFFRGHEVNPHYWGEKVQDGRERIKNFSEDAFKQLVEEHLADLDDEDLDDKKREAIRELRGGITAGDGYYEEGARELLREGEQAGLFSDVWEWDLSDWDWHFLYCLNAIVAGIAAYDAAKAAKEPMADAQPATSDGPR